MMEIYPFGGLWAYMKFHFIDGINKQSIMLLDKTRVNYNSNGEKKKEIIIKSTKSEEEFNGMLRRYGFGTTDMTDEQRIERISNELEKQ